MHVANGLFRDLLGEIYDTKGPVSFLIPWKKKNDPNLDPKRTYAHLVEDPGEERFEAFKGGAENERRFEHFREYLRGLLAADNAVFPQPHNSSLSLTCRQMVSPDRFDREVGRFMAAILRGREGTGALGRIVTECLTKDSNSPVDPITFASWPLLRSEYDEGFRKSNRSGPYNKKLSAY